MSDGIRQKRLAGTILRHLSEELARSVADPRLAGLSIQQVELTSDLSIAKVQVRFVLARDGDEPKRVAMETLGRIAPGLRASLAPLLKMRRVPELIFSYDVGADRRDRISDVLEEIKREDAEKRALIKDTDSEDSPS